MSRFLLDRRQFLTLPLALVLAPLGAVRASAEARQAAYGVDVGVLYDLFTFHLPGTITETVDRAAGRYEVTAVGRGSRIANRIESRGILRNGRWAPLEASGWFDVAGRQSRSQVRYDYERRVIEYHYRGETFMLRRVRVADDIVAIPPGLHVDDVITAVLNYGDGFWPAEADGSYRTHVVRRRRSEREGPDDVEKTYRAELLPAAFRTEPDPDTGRAAALLDLAPFSSWSVKGRPARVVFGAGRRPELVTASLMLGTSVTIRLRPAA